MAGPRSVGWRQGRIQPRNYWHASRRPDTKQELSTSYCNDSKTRLGQVAEARYRQVILTSRRGTTRFEISRATYGDARDELTKVQEEDRASSSQLSHVATAKRE
jgi:hypothetical protein